jgi:hypothetical protein
LDGSAPVPVPDPDAGVTPTGFLDVVVFFFVVVVFVFVASFAGPELSVPMPEDFFFLPEVVAASVFFDVVVVLDFDALAAEVVVAGVVAGVVAAALCEVVLDESSPPQPASTRASTTPVVAVSFRGTAGTIAPAGRGVCRN